MFTAGKEKENRGYVTFLRYIMSIKKYLLLSPGLHMGQTLPSMKPKWFCKAAPLCSCKPVDQKVLQQLDAKE